MKARYPELKEESDGITLEDFDFSKGKKDIAKHEEEHKSVKEPENDTPSKSKQENDLEEFSNSHFVVLDTDGNGELERARGADREGQKDEDAEEEEKSAGPVSESGDSSASGSNASPKSDKSAATRKRKRGSCLSDEERRKRNTEASARFRIKRRMREQEMSERLKKIRAHIAELKVKEKTLSMENECLKRMLLGDAAIGASLASNNASSGLNIDSMSNYQLLNLMRQKSSEGFRITTV